MTIFETVPGKSGALWEKSANAFIEPHQQLTF